MLSHVDNNNKANMLDNAKETLGTAQMLPTLANLATGPTCCEDANRNSYATPNKAKTIFSWLKSATKSFDSGETPLSDNKRGPISNNGVVSVNDEPLPCPTVGENPSQQTQQQQHKPHKQLRANSLPTTDVSLREFRGVQSLRHLWNKRISASEELTRCSKSSLNNKLNKSIGCLVHASKVAEPSSVHSKIDALNARCQLTAQRKRAQSLHDCTSLEEEDDPPVTAATKIDCLHREKDNFYKYKTAEQASKHLAREAHVRAKSRRVTAGIVTDSSVAGACHFPAFEASARGERIHWLKRQDIVMKRCAESSATSSEMTVAEACVRSVATPVVPLSVDVISSSDDSRGNEPSNACQQHVPTLATTPRSTAAAVSPTSGDNRSISSDTDTLTATNSPQHASRRRNTQRETTTALLVHSKHNSTDSTISSGSTAGGRSARRTPSTSSSSSGTSRKYSFKTHTRSYHPSRRMSNRDSTSGGSGGGGGSNGAAVGANFSMVAKLTQQFNEIIQKDKKLLEEVKRKNGVLMSRGGHVYKVVQTSSLETAKKSSPSVSRNGSRAKDVSARGSMVQRNIRKFEGDGQALAVSEKPAVPAKSEQVLRKLNEHNRNAGMPMHQKRLHLHLPPDLKKAQLAISLSPPLEVVKEESKTPLDTEEKPITSALEVNVPNGQTTVGTYGTIGIASANGSADCAPSISSNKINIADHAETKVNSTTNGPTTETANTQMLMSAADNVDTERYVRPGELAETLAQSEHNKVEQAQQLPADDSGNQHANTAATVTAIGASCSSAGVPTNQQLNVATELARIVAEEQKLHASTDDEPDADVSDEKARQRKRKYAKIYEKFRFRSPFSGGHSKKLSPSKEALNSTTTGKNDAEETPPVTDATTPINMEAEAKLLDALEAVDLKLKGLTKEEQEEKNIVICENDDFEQRVLPNNSFVFQASAKQVVNNQLIVAQAVNVALVNSIEGEQMIMEQKELQQTKLQAGDAQASDETPMVVMVDVGAEILVKRVANIAIVDEALYELIEPKTEESTTTTTPAPSAPQSFLYKQLASSKSSENVQNPSTEEDKVQSELVEDIYQTVEEALKQTEAPASPQAEMMPSDYESIAGSSELATRAAMAKQMFYDGYEICEPPAEPEAGTTTTQASSTVALAPNLTTQVSRNTTDELPELPKPKRRLPKSPMPGKRPSKPSNFTNRNNHPEHVDGNANAVELLQDNDDQHYYADDENIYDTIKGSHCYESLHAESVKSQKSSNKSSDTMSLTSNCYESIAHYRRLPTNGGHMNGSSSGSTLTISSDHKTNSLYEMSMAASIGYVGASSLGYGRQQTKGAILANAGATGAHGGVTNGGQQTNNNQYCYSNTASSENSDEWVDISDPEGDGERQFKQQFIVVRERSKVHRSPVWSKRVRDKRLHQKKAKSFIDDDSDHYYESLSPLSSKRHSTQLVQRTNSHHKRNQDLPKYALNATQRSKPYAASAHALGNPISDDYDSFDTDIDEVYETEENAKNNNDSGVDIRKLPDPPASTNQVYAIVRKLKNFISNKKSPGSSSKYGGSQQKLYENSTQFYVNDNIYENTPKTKSKTPKVQSGKKAASLSPVTATQDSIYENTEFHTPSPPTTADGKPLSSSEKNLSGADATPVPAVPTAESATLRSKSKSGKSFKSRLRKSLVGFDNKQLSTLTSTRSTFYIEDPSYGGSGELDSGFSEKASSGDLPTTPSMPTSEAQKFSTVVRKAKKEAKSANSLRRRTTIGIRPHEPPPPPPVATTNSSWYTECGVFKQGSALDEQSLSGSKSTTYSQLGSTIVNGSSWYAEAGLYQTSGVSVASSSGSSGVSTGNEGGLGDEPHSMFQNEPLYQIYNDAKMESIQRDMEDHDSSTDGYEEIGQLGIGSGMGARNEECRKSTRPTAFQLIEPKNGPSRTLWSEVPEVINSCILLTLTPRERSLQEAKFEVITSEASYLKSLNLLRSHFMNHPVFRDTNVVSASDRKALFAHIVPVHECSDRLLTELETCWQDNIMLLGMSKRIYAIAEKYFHVYISFCEHQGHMDRTLRRLKESKGIFTKNLDLLESSPACCGLKLHSFLMLPMQRITRLPLLIDAVFSKINPNDDEYESWKMTLAIMNKMVAQCNDAANRCEQAYEIKRISRQLEFPSTIRALAIAPAGVPAPGSKPRFLVKKGELTHLIWRGDEVKLTFGKKFTKSTIYAFLFSDLLVLTKRKGEEQFTVFDYCPRNMLTISSGDMKDISQTHRNLILMTLLENNERKTVELVLSCPSVSEQERWLQAVRPPEPETPGEKLYESWDCPQVIAKYAYDVKEPDALNLEVGDVVNVTRKLPDGWYQGERIRDGAIGWFPGSFTEEVNSAHVRARNLKQRQRLLTFTATYLETQKRKF